MKKNLNILKIILIILSLLVVFFLFVFVLLFTTKAVTDFKYYNYYVTSEKLKKVFPTSIPSNVKNLKFYYEPGFLQGGTTYSLYYIDDNMTKEIFDKEYKKKAIWIGHKEEYTKKEGLLDGAFLYTPTHYENEKDYIIYLIEGRCDDSGYCNHGEFLIAAFNEKTNEVLFCFEQW